VVGVSDSTDPADDGTGTDADANGGPDAAAPETDASTVVSPTSGASTGPDGAGSARSRVRRAVDYAILAGLGLLAFVAVVQFYLAVDATINQWVTREYRAPFRAIFNLAVLLAVGAGIYRQVDRITGEGTDSDAD
jgi:hypothetical protein